tara:strand:- start:2266 stop:3651 length:1386 start_codon:yes stop_codon:yes gene_type:complete
MNVIRFNGHSSNLFRIFYQGDPNFQVKTYYIEDGYDDMFDEKGWDIFTLFLFDLDGHFLNKDIVKNMRKLISNANTNFKIVIDGFGEGSDMGMRWKFIYKFCSLYGIRPDQIYIYATTLNVLDSHDVWRNMRAEDELIPRSTMEDNYIIDKEDFNQWIYDTKKPLLNIYDNIYLPFVYFGVNDFTNKDGWISSMAGEYNRLYDTDGLQLKMNKEIRNNKILSLIANPMKHRILVTLHLLKKQYQKEGLISFNDDLKDETMGKEEFQDFKKILTQLDTLDYYDTFLKNIPIRIDWETFDNSQSFEGRYSPNYEFYKDSYFSVVTETNYELEYNTWDLHQHETIFLTEKTLNALWCYHPFVIVNAKYSLKKLREMGFQTFPELFDESYDDEPHPVKRLKMVLDEVDRVMKMDKEELHKIYNSMEEKFIHNRNVILDIVLNKTPIVYKEISQEIIPPEQGKEGF